MSDETYDEMCERINSITDADVPPTAKGVQG